MRTMVIVIIMLTLIASSPALSIEDVAFARLSAARSLKCQFGQGSTAEWVKGKLKVENASFTSDPAKAKIHYDSINVKANTARIIGEGGSSDARAQLTAAGITIIEQPLLGGIVTTTIFASYDSAGGFAAVMSKHVDLMGPFPQTYYGTCRVWD